MRIYKKLLILFLCLVLCPMLIVGTWSYHTGRATLEKEIIAKLEGIAEHRAKEIEAYFRERWGDVLAIQPSTFIKENITIVSRFVEDKGNPEYIEAAARLDNRLKVYKKAYGYHNIALINPEGKVVYNLNKAHSAHKTGIQARESLRPVFEKGREGISFSDVYRDENEPEQLLITIIAPVHDAKGTFIGEIAFDVDMQIFYELIQDNTGLGSTGEIQIGKQVADGALFLSPLRYDPDAVLKRTVKPGDKVGIPTLNAVQGKTGSGFSIDYRGEQVIAVWRHIPFLDWGMVVKVDVWDTFAPVVTMRNKVLALLIVCLVLGTGIVYLIVRTITLPITNLTNMAKKVHEGDMSARTQVTSRDEIGDLGKYFNKMAEGLITTNISLEQKVQERTEKLESLNDALAKEVAEHKRAEENVRIFSHAVASAYDGILLTDLQGNVTYANDAACTILGYTIQEMLKQNVIRFTRTADESRNIIASAVKKGSWGGDILAVKKDMDTFPVILSVSIIKDDAGNPGGTIGIFRDVTEQRQASRHARSLIEASLDPLVTISQEGKIADVNEATVNVTGVPREQLIGSDFSRYFTETERAQEGYRLVFSKGALSDYPLTIRHKNGRLTHVLYNASVFKNLDGNVVGVFAAARDVTLQRQAEEALRRRTAELETILDAIPVYVWIGLDPECRVITGNRAANALFGVAPGTNVSQSVVAVGQAPYIKQLKGDGSEYRPDELPMQRSIALRQPVRNAMLDFVFPDGRRIFAMGNAVPLLDAQGNPRGSVAAFVDITERNRMERALRESEERYSSLVVATAQIVWTTNARGEVSGDIPSWRALTGQSVDDIKGWGWINALHPDDRERTAALWRRAVEERTLYDTEYRLRRYDGEYRHLAVRGVPVLEKDGSIREWVGTCNDITVQRHDEHITSLKNQIAHCFITISDDEMYAGVLQLVLKEMGSEYGVFGYLDEQGALVVPTMTRDIWDKCQIPDKDIVFPREKWGDSTWPRAIREKRTICQNEISAKSPQGHIPMFRHISLPILFHEEVIGLFQVANKAADYDEKDVAALTMIADTVAPILHARLQRDRLEKERKRAEEKVKGLNAKLAQRLADVEAANKELESFSYSVSHDLRTPLRAIDGFSKMLLEDYADKLDAEGNRRLNVVRSSTQKMGQLIDDILAFSRIGRKEMTVQAIPMDQLVNEVYQELSALVPQENREFALVGARGGASLPPAFGDRAMIRQVVVNLVSNALKFTRGRKSAVIQVGSWVEGDENPPVFFAEGAGQTTPPWEKGDNGERKDTFNVYYVRDNGVGFDMKYADKLFGVFQRLHSAEEFEGTGAGLAIVKQIITRHGGKVWAEAKVGEGAVFYFSLPKHPSENVKI